MDFLTDNNPKNLALLDDVASFQKFAKEASKSASDVSRLNWKAFADPTKRQFPINTAANTLSSYAYFKSAGLKDLYIEQNILSAVSNFKLEKEAAEIDVKLQEVEEKKASETQDYALIASEDGENFEGYYPIDTEFNLEKSAECIYEDRNNMPGLEYRTACFQVVKRAKEMGVIDRIPTTIKDVGANREPNIEMLQLGLNKRARAMEATNEVEAKMYREVSKLVKRAHDEDDDAALVYYFDAITQLDRQNGLYKHAKSYENPYAMYFSGDPAEGNEKLASKVVLVETSDEKSCLIPLEDFQANLEKIANSVCEGESREGILKLAKAKSASVVTLALKSWKDEDKKELISNIYQFSSNEN